MKQVLIVEVESNSSERFLHEIAGKLRFGRESIQPLIQKPKEEPGSIGLGKNAGVRNVCRVRIWKPPLFMVSTTKKAESMSIGPFGGLSLEDDVDDHSTASGADDSKSDSDGDLNAFESSDKDTMDLRGRWAAANRRLTRPEICVNWEVTYSLSTKGEVLTTLFFLNDLIICELSYHFVLLLQLLIRSHVDCSELPFVVPRVGLALCLRSKEAVDTVMWRGYGPHECYPVFILLWCAMRKL